MAALAIAPETTPAAAACQTTTIETAVTPFPTFTIDREVLLSELAFVTRAIEKRGTIPVLQNVLLSAQDNGVLRITGTDLEIGLVSDIMDANILEPGAVTIPAKRLLDLVKRLPGTAIRFQPAGTSVTIVCGRTVTTMPAMTSESYPELPAEPEASAFIPAEVLLNLIERTDYAISKEESRFTLNGALLTLKDGAVTMVATDGHRLSFATAPQSHFETIGAIVPTATLAELSRLLSKVKRDVLFSMDDNHLFFRVGDRLVISRKLTGNFPDYERVLPKEFTCTAFLNVAGFKAAINRALPFADERSHSMRFRLAEDSVTVETEADGGKYTESVEACVMLPPNPEPDAETDEPRPEPWDRTIGFNGKYVLDVLAATSEPEIIMCLVDGKHAGEFRPAGNDSVRHVLMPMRI